MKRQSVMNPSGEMQSQTVLRLLPLYPCKHNFVYYHFSEAEEILHDVTSRVKYHI